jgi:hypothetical protein
MVLGETLSAVKTHIMKDLGLTINGWFMDDDEGWGPPSYVIARMESEGWCRRAQTVLRGAAGSQRHSAIRGLCKPRRQDERQIRRR